MSLFDFPLNNKYLMEILFEFAREYYVECHILKYLCDLVIMVINAGVLSILLFIIIYIIIIYIIINNPLIYLSLKHDCFSPTMTN
jgi:hypothetical protein